MITEAEVLHCWHHDRELVNYAVNRRTGHLFGVVGTTFLVFADGGGLRWIYASTGGASPCRRP